MARENYERPCGLSKANAKANVTETEKLFRSIKAVKSASYRNHFFKKTPAKLLPKLIDDITCFFFDELPFYRIEEQPLCCELYTGRN